MLRDTCDSIGKFIEQKAIVSCLMFAVIVLVIDYVTGRQIRFPIIYVIPAGMAAWLEHKPTAYAMAIFMPLARVGFHFPWHETQSLTIEQHGRQKH
jgi:hypothetical protein